MIMQAARAVLLVLALLPAIQTAAEEHINYINMFIRLDEERSCGLQRLTSAERERLNEVFKGIVEEKQDNLRNCALAYLRNSGWDEVQVTGTEVAEVEAGLGPRRYVMAARGGTRYTLEPESYSTLMPGQYLGAIDSAGYKIIDPQGSVVEFWIRKTEPGQ
jgi:hypothetical protein